MYKARIRKRDETTPLRYDPKFVEICKEVGYSPKYQYQLLQLILQVPEDIMEEVKSKFDNFMKNEVKIYQHQ